MPSYLKNKELLAEVIYCRDASIIASAKLVDMYYMIAENLSHTYKFSDDDRKDAIQQAVIDCYRYSHNFDPCIGTNAFAYFTQIAKNGFNKSIRVLHPFSTISMGLRFDI